MFGCKSSKVVFIDCLPILGFVFFKFLCTQEPGATCSPPALQVKTLGDFPHNLRHQSGTPSVPSADSNTWRKQTAARGLRPASAWPSTVTGTPSATSRHASLLISSAIPRQARRETLQMSFRGIQSLLTDTALGLCHAGC